MTTYRVIGEFDAAYYCCQVSRAAELGDFPCGVSAELKASVTLGVDLTDMARLVVCVYSDVIPATPLYFAMSLGDCSEGNARRWQDLVTEHRHAAQHHAATCEIEHRSLIEVHFGLLDDVAAGRGRA